MEEIRRERMIQRTYMTTRSVIFLLCAVMSFVMIFSFASNMADIMKYATAIVLYFFLWSATIRFISGQSLTFLKVILNSALATAPIAYFDITGNPLPTNIVFLMIMPITGVTALGTVKGDGRARLTSCDFLSEFLYPLLGALAVSAVLYPVSLAGAYTSFSLPVLTAGVILTSVSLLSQRMTGKKMVFSSPKISGFEDTPSSDYSNFTDYLKIRLVIVAFIVIYVVFGTALDELASSGMISDLDIWYPLLGLLIFPLMILLIPKIAGRNSFGICLLPYEAVMAIYIFSYRFIGFKDVPYDELSVPISAIFIFIYLLVDLILSGTVLTYKRRTITAHLPECLSGVPIFLIYIAVASMIIESFAMIF